MKVTVLGAGLAGCTAVYYLTKEGISVELIDKSKFLRDSYAKEDCLILCGPSDECMSGMWERNEGYWGDNQSRRVNSPGRGDFS